MPLKQPIRIVQRGGQTQVMRGRPAGSSDQNLEPQDLSQEIPSIKGVLAETTQALMGKPDQQRSCGCGGD